MHAQKNLPLIMDITTYVRALLINFFFYELASDYVLNIPFTINKLLLLLLSLVVYKIKLLMEPQIRTF